MHNSLDGKGGVGGLGPDRVANERCRSEGGIDEIFDGGAADDDSPVTDDEAVALKLELDLGFVGCSADVGRSKGAA